jgi:hypothetical protein
MFPPFFGGNSDWKIGSISPGAMILAPIARAWQPGHSVGLGILPFAFWNSYTIFGDFRTKYSVAGLQVKHGRDAGCITSQILSFLLVARGRMGKKTGTVYLYRLVPPPSCDGCCHDISKLSPFIFPVYRPRLSRGCACHRAQARRRERRRRKAAAVDFFRAAFRRPHRGDFAVALRSRSGVRRPFLPFRRPGGRSIAG